MQVILKSHRSVSESELLQDDEMLSEVKPERYGTEAQKRPRIPVRWEPRAGVLPAVADLKFSISSPVRAGKRKVAFITQAQERDLPTVYSSGRPNFQALLRKKANSTLWAP